MHGGSVWTADHTCRRREAVDESGEQPEGRPSRSAMETGSQRSRAQPKGQRGRKGEGSNGSKGEMEEKKAIPCTSYSTFPPQALKQQQQQRRCACNDLPDQVRRGGDYYTACDGRPSDDPVFTADDFGAAVQVATFTWGRTNMYAADTSGEAIQFDGFCASSYPSKLDSLCSSVKPRDGTRTDCTYARWRTSTPQSATMEMW